MIATQTLCCTFIMTGDGQYLTDHHNRENEILISSTPQKTRKRLIEYLIDSAFDSEKLPDFISDKEVIDAVVTMVNFMSNEDCYPSYYEEELNKTDEDGWFIDCNINAYAYLSW